MKSIDVKSLLNQAGWRHMKYILLMIALVALVGCGKKTKKPNNYESKKDSALLQQLAENLEDSAAAGDKFAQHQVGGMYFFGEYPKERDLVTAYAWTYISASNGWSVAEDSMPIIAKSMTTNQIAKAEELVKEMVKKNPKLLNKE